MTGLNAPMQENWPRPHWAGDCGCAKCRRKRAAWWQDPSRHRAQIAAQNRFVDNAVETVLAELEAEAESSKGAGVVRCHPPRLDHCIRWDRNKTLEQILSGDKRYRDATRQWVYRVRIRGDSRPLYVGKTGPASGGLVKRMSNHFPLRSRTAAIPLTNALREAALNAAGLHRGGKLVRRGSGKTKRDTEVLNRAINMIGAGNFHIDVGEVCRIDPRHPGECRPPRRGANILLERVELFRGRARVNRPDRAEDEVAEAAVADLKDNTFESEVWQ